MAAHGTKQMFQPADLRLLSGVELPLDAGSAAMRSGAAAPDALLDRLLLT